MKTLPVSMLVDGRSCLVVGGGEVAARKVDLLLRAGAQVTVVAPKLGTALQASADAGRIVHRREAFDEPMLDRQALVVAATDDQRINGDVAQAAQRMNIAVNVVDQPHLCTFVFPSVVDRSPVTVAVSSGGSSPVLARLLRARLETYIPSSYGRLADLLGSYRSKAKQRFPDMRQRRRFWERVVQGPIAELMFSGQEDAAKQALDAAIATGTVESRGEVYLVGAGPGDPDLLTFRALRLMQQADVVLYDRLVSPAILDLVRRDAEHIYVGKHRANHTLRQADINRTLAALAKEGKRVLRLKGGDPFIFGRGGEEIATLAEEGIAFQVVPGITAAAGCAAYAGIPLTHRDYAQSVMFVTGQLKDGSVDLNWPALVQPKQTVVVYMGLAGLEVICRKLQEHGLNGDTPAALVEQGTTPSQRVIAATVATLPGMVAGQTVHAPTLLIVGDVVRLHATLGWYEPGAVRRSLVP